MTNVVLRRQSSLQSQIAAKNSHVSKQKFTGQMLLCKGKHIISCKTVSIYSVRITDLENDIYQLDKEMFQLD